MDYENQQETLFNAGVDTALQISKLAKQAEMYSTIGDYQNQHLKYESMELWMSPKFRIKEKADQELTDIKEKYTENFKKYLTKISKGKKISKPLSEDVKEFLTKYGKCLMFWRDKFGYGMPLKDDARYVLG